MTFCAINRHGVVFKIYNFYYDIVSAAFSFPNMNLEILAYSRILCYLEECPIVLSMV